MNWDHALVVPVTSFVTTVVARFVFIRIATKAGIGTGMAILLGVSMPIGLLVLAVSEWRVDRRVRAMERFCATHWRSPPAAEKLAVTG